MDSIEFLRKVQEIKNAAAVKIEGVDSIIELNSTSRLKVEILLDLHERGPIQMTELYKLMDGHNFNSASKKKFIVQWLDSLGLVLRQRGMIEEQGINDERKVYCALTTKGTTVVNSILLKVSKLMEKIAEEANLEK